MLSCFSLHSRPCITGRGSAHLLRARSAVGFCRRLCASHMRTRSLAKRARHRWHPLGDGQLRLLRPAGGLDHAGIERAGLHFQKLPLAALPPGVRRKGAHAASMELETVSTLYHRSHHAIRSSRRAASTGHADVSSRTSSMMRPHTPCACSVCMATHPHTHHLCSMGPLMTFFTSSSTCHGRHAAVPQVQQA